MTRPETWTPDEIKALRLWLRMTQDEFARATGASRVSVWYWEQGKRAPAFARQKALDELALESRFRIGGG